jgi:hypothetical protein
MVDEAVVDGVKGEFEAIGDAELIEDVVEMILNGLLGDEKFFANFLVPETLSDELNDFFLAVAEQRLFAARASFGRFGESLHDFCGHAIVEPDFASVNAMNALDQEIGSGLLQNHAARAKTHGPNHIAIVFSGRENHHACGQSVEIHFFENSETVFIGHTQVEQKNVRLQLGEELNALGTVLGLSDDGDVFVGLEEFAETIAKDGVVVG